jgi:hypothetical protein
MAQHVMVRGLIERDQTATRFMLTARQGDFRHRPQGRDP